ncbi:amino acid ABC transporter substrate-binding protein, PAAT family [Rhizobium tibeticum]|uniref:Amino acid ABC transporter substrate-binding protein, PAAT family n=1 Tax=Rhizobium tibeticum TaxID=501024 RepID=A0A1H8WGV1_9HYPH|nr:transporter substrate-binding domain-containing protein [Rhizobium tibeticum]SEI21087.1 putative amino-acid ABC transporter-binding protein precursor [Rhizobium tibeticum]SEP26851.1 amino acid ABC transporter substrate-binding protein, PAAT family [Rhizobium tibeticum]
MNKLMRMIAAASFAVTSVTLSTPVHAGQVLDRVLTTKTLTVAVGTDWGKMSFLNDKQELDGSDIDLAKAIAERLGVQVKFVTPGWDVIISGKWQGRWDMAMGQMTPTKARAEKFDFPAAYFYSPAVIAVHKDSKSTQLSDLDGKTVGVLVSTVGELYANHKLTPDWINAKPIEYQFTPGEVKSYGAGTYPPIDDLRLGDGVRLDAVVGEEDTVLQAIEAGYPLKIIQPPLYSAPCSFAVLRDDHEFTAKIKEAVESIRKEGSLSKMTIKWYGVDRSIEH